MKKIEFFRHCIDEQDIQRVNGVLRSIFLTTGESVDEFERHFSRYMGSTYTVGLTSCTAALQLSLTEYGIGPGHEVITTPMSFCATANAVLQAGARPVFVDVEEDTGNINAALIEKAITEKTRAIIPVHIYGQMCDMKGIRAIADRHGFRIIEDAAHAIEASRDGVRPGALSDTACFSFYATKNITCGEGGAATTNDRNVYENLKMTRLHGIDAEASARYTKRYRHWDMPVFGWKYNMDNIQAALLTGQLDRIDDLWRKRDALWKLYEEGLRGTRNLRLLRTLENTTHARHLFTVLVDPEKREDILLKIQERGIGVAVNYRPIHLLKYFRETFGYSDGDYPVAEEIGRSTISLPLYPSLRREDAGYVIQVLKDIL